MEATAMGAAAMGATATPQYPLVQQLLRRNIHWFSSCYAAISTGSAAATPQYPLNQQQRNQVLLEMCSPTGMSNLFTQHMTTILKSSIDIVESVPGVPKSKKKIGL